MNELNVDEFFEVYNRFCSGEKISRILSRDFPFTDITVLLGTHLIFQDQYVHDAFLFRDTMEMALAEVKKNEQFSAKPYFLARGTIEEVNEGILYALPFPKKVDLSQADRMNIYDRIENNFRQRINSIGQV